MCNNSQRGEALIDVIIGTAILGYFAVTMYGAVINLTRLSAAGAKRIQGVWIANSYMEELMGLPLDDKGDDEEDDYDDLKDFSDYNNYDDLEDYRNKETSDIVPEWWPLDDDYGFWVRTQTLSVKVNMDTGELVESADPDFTKLTVTLDEGGLNTDEVLTLQTLRPGAAPPEIEL